MLSIPICRTWYNHEQTTNFKLHEVDTHVAACRHTTITCISTECTHAKSQSSKAQELLACKI